MAHVSVFDVLRPGPGPSSAQTIGPFEAARRFTHALAADGLVGNTVRVHVELYGALACNGRANRTAEAIIAGLAGHRPEAADAGTLDLAYATVGGANRLPLGGKRQIGFDVDRDIAWRVDRALPGASNALRLIARDSSGGILAERYFLSIGDGEVVEAAEARLAREAPRLPYLYTNARALLDVAAVAGKHLAGIGLANEAVFRSPGDIRRDLAARGDLMLRSVVRGLSAVAELPGGTLRRAPAQAEALRGSPASPAQWCAVYAQAVAEENAAGGAVVAAPTQGAAGPVAALLAHWRNAGPLEADEGTLDYLLTAGVVGGLLRTLGLRQAGCQGVVGVASAMAAAGYAALLGATNAQVLLAAELALAPHLGQACDPTDGRTQKPCIARNAAAAAQAHVAAHTALARQNPVVGLDNVALAMIESARSMATRYKDASPAGAALNVTEC
ncbi:MAG: L-serine ammonia-lyase, iron-sulfur-dependent, subunit alpha [Proteobacteria bacterium]|nr:L-serine ammonia-lyase, iron-sulfur-dependent, subunit alpha [Pseudomonadota bacterium]